MIYFMKGYKEENDFDFVWFEKILDFFCLCYMLIYGLLYQVFDFDLFGDEEFEMLKGFRCDIENKILIIEYNFIFFV